MIIEGRGTAKHVLNTEVLKTRNIRKKEREIEHVPLWKKAKNKLSRNLTNLPTSKDLFSSGSAIFN